MVASVGSESLTAADVRSVISLNSHKVNFNHVSPMPGIECTYLLNERLLQIDKGRVNECCQHLNEMMEFQALVFVVGLVNGVG